MGDYNSYFTFIQFKHETLNMIYSDEKILSKKLITRYELEIQ